MHQSINESQGKEVNSLTTSDITVATEEPLLVPVFPDILPVQGSTGRGYMGQWDSFHGDGPALLICRCCNYALDGGRVPTAEQLFHIPADALSKSTTWGPYATDVDPHEQIFMSSSDLASALKTEADCVFALYKESSLCASASAVM